MYGSHKEIYFQPLKVCVATINTGLFYFMPVRKQYECVTTFNKLELEIDEDNHLLLTMNDEENNTIEISITRGDLLDLIQELEVYNQLLWENEKSSLQNACIKSERNGMFDFSHSLPISKWGWITPVSLAARRVITGLGELFIFSSRSSREITPSLVPLMIV